MLRETLGDLPRPISVPKTRTLHQVQIYRIREPLETTEKVLSNVNDVQFRYSNCNCGVLTTIFLMRAIIHEFEIINGFASGFGTLSFPL